MFERLDNTIVAVSSGRERGRRAVVRVNGPQAFALCDAVFRSVDGASLASLGGYRRATGHILLDEGAESTTPGKTVRAGEVSVAAEAYCFRRPASYTREDLVELHTVGSPPIVSMVLEQLVSLGARPAEPGEFTARAYFAGGLDLSEVEGVAAMIHAASDAQLRAAERLLHGGLSRFAAEIHEELAELLALVEAEIDFVEEPITFITPGELKAGVQRVTDRMESLLRSSASSERLDVLPRVLLAGAANVGKSSLFNRLTGLDRAICSGLAGTTRDVLTAPMRAGSGEVLLMDAAGFGGPPGRIGQAAESAARRAALESDLVVWVFDLTCEEPATPVDRLRSATGRAVVAASKSDVLDEAELKGRLERLEPAAEQVAGRAGTKPLATSAVTGAGCTALADAIGSALAQEHSGAASIALSARHRDALASAVAALTRATALCEKTGAIEQRAELLAFELREASEAAGTITGAVGTDALLGRVFARFCIGK